MSEEPESSTGGSAEPADEAQVVAPRAPARGRGRFLRARWVAAGVVVVLAISGFVAWRQINPALSSKYRDVAYTVPTAPRLAAGAGETVYRIDPSTSSLSYAVHEKIVGQDAHTAVGTTNGISGDLAVNPTHPAASRAGDIVVNVEELHSDSSLRDARIRADFLQSHQYPLATFGTATLSGLPAAVPDGKQVHFTMTGTLTVRNRPATVTWDVDATTDKGTLKATATTKVKLSTWGIGPINLAGLLSTSNDATLTMHLTAKDPSKFVIPQTIAAPASATKSGKSPSFKAVVMPVLQSSCASCHSTGQVGASHWKLETAGDAANISSGIGVVVRSKYMPPWPASSKGIPLAHSRALDQQTIDQIAAWADAGGKLDVPATTPVKATEPPAGTTPRADVVLKMPKAYAGTISVPNDYRCFVLNPGFTTPTYITGFQVTPDQRAEIHHVQIFHVDATQVAQSAKLDGADGKPGWSCYGGPDLPGARTRRRRPTNTVPSGAASTPTTATTIASQMTTTTVLTPAEQNAARARTLARSAGFIGQPGLIAGWVPGQDPAIYPAGSGILFEPGDAVVLQMHYHYNTTPTPDRTSVAFQTAPGTTPLKELTVVNPIGPVEIPCMAGVQAPLCDRSAAIADDAKLYGPSGASNETGLLALCGKTAAEVAASFKDGVASSTCDSKVPFDGTMVSALGHMHTLGKSFRLTLDPGTPQQKVLLDIPTWNFDWQMDYGFATPLHVKAGETIRMDCSWDRSLDPNRPPKYIVFAEGTEDEMCFATYGLIADDPPPAASSSTTPTSSGG